MAATNLAVAFLETVRAHGSNIALLRKKEGNYVGIDYEELHRQVKNLALGLAASGVRKGDRVSIFSFNRPEWAISDLA
ncbi:MAG: AMP-binding protein, partial [Calditrichaeota bacterium]|nr:AMP-binding protein [Calditrichota bacterium]